MEANDRKSVDAESDQSGPLAKRTSKKSARFNVPEPSAVFPAVDKDNIDEEEYVEVTLDLIDDKVALNIVKDPGVTMLARTLERRRSSSFGSSALRSASERIRQVSRELRRLSGARNIDRTKSVTSGALKGLKFISRTDGASGWQAVEKRFHMLTNKGREPLSKASFGKCIGMEEFNEEEYMKAKEKESKKKEKEKESKEKEKKSKKKEKEPEEFPIVLFEALARRSQILRDWITKEELWEFWVQISDQSFTGRLQIFFDMIDKNADGRISKEEVRKIITLSASANKLLKIEEHAEDYASLIMEALDPDNLGYIEIYNLETLLLQTSNESIQHGRSDNRSLSQMLSARMKPTHEPNPLKRWYRKATYFLEDNWKRVWVIAVWFLICAGIFAWKFVQYRNRAVFHVMGYCVCTAKGGAETLKFNMALVLLPVCRKTITWLRNRTKLGAVVPFDDNLNFHKVIAVGIAVGVGLHAGSHLTCDFPRLLHASDEEYEPMKPFFGSARPDDYWWFVKGTEGWTGIVMVALMAVAFTLATPWFRRGWLNLPKPLKRLTGFNAFWYSHHLFVLVYVLLVVHGTFLYLSHKWYKKTTWMYLAVPVILYATERLIRAFRSSIKPVKMEKVVGYPGNVLSLHVSKPQGFKYQSGQYIFVNCPAVSRFQWHPFSITSAPQDNYIGVHIRSLGDWTGQLWKVCQPFMDGKSGLLGAEPNDNNDSNNNSRIGPIFPKVLIDGPYGAPAQDYKNYEVVLLVGLGIGATPFISILKDIINNMKQLEPKGTVVGQVDIDRGGDGSKVGSSFKTRRAYFYWLTREQGTFEWFKRVMDEVAETDVNGAIELHNHCTSVYKEGDVRSALVAMLQSLNHTKNGVDVVSGTRVMSHFAKPNWRDVYKRIALNHQDQRIGVFYCGAPALTNELRQHAKDFSRKTTTKFDFHKENF